MPSRDKKTRFAASRSTSPDGETALDPSKSALGDREGPPDPSNG